MLLFATTRRMAIRFVMLPLLSALIAFPLSQPAFATEYVVFSLEGTAEGITLGQVLNAGDRIVLPQGTSIKLVSKAGEIVSLSGPATAIVTAEPENKAGEDALLSISDLLFGDDQFVKTLGGSRSFEASGHAGTDDQRLVQGLPWNPKLSQTRHYCLNPSDPKLARPSVDRAWTVSLNVVGSEQTTEIQWAAGETELSLADQTVPNTDYLMFIEETGRTLFVHMASQLEQSPLLGAAWMTQKGCKAQAYALLSDSAANAK